MAVAKAEAEKVGVVETAEVVKEEEERAEEEKAEVAEAADSSTERRSE